MKEKDPEKKAYEEPTIVKHGELADITGQDGGPTVGSVVEPNHV